MKITKITIEDIIERAEKGQVLSPYYSARTISLFFKTKITDGPYCDETSDGESITEKEDIIDCSVIDKISSETGSKPDEVTYGDLIEQIAVSDTSEEYTLFCRLISRHHDSAAQIRINGYDRLISERDLKLYDLFRIPFCDYMRFFISSGISDDEKKTFCNTVKNIIRSDHDDIFSVWKEAESMNDSDEYINTLFIYPLLKIKHYSDLRKRHPEKSNDKTAEASAKNKGGHHE